MIKNLIISLIMLVIQPNVDVIITPDIFYYNRTNGGMESGRINIDYYHIEIHRGTSIEIYYFIDRDYDEEEQIYTFNTKCGKQITFDPSMRKLLIGDDEYYINSTIKSNW